MSPDPGLTDFEEQILQRLADGSTSKEIADELGVSWESVKAHVHEIIRKLRTIPPRPG
jgi:DNA-binding NarL/FixJ family response regulator